MLIYNYPFKINYHLYDKPIRIHGRLSHTSSEIDWLGRPDDAQLSIIVVSCFRPAWLIPRRRPQGKKANRMTVNHPRCHRPPRRADGSDCTLMIRSSHRCDGFGQFERLVIKYPLRGFPLCSRGATCRSGQVDFCNGQFSTLLLLLRATASPGGI